MYYRDTLQNFNLWHVAVCVAEGLPKIGYVDGYPAPQNQQTTAYVEPIQNPNGSNDYIWAYGKYPISGKQALLQADIDILNWSAA